MSGDWLITEISFDSPPNSGNIEINPENNVEDFQRNSSEARSSVYKQNGGIDDAKSKWISGAWPISMFDESLPTNKRKAEWFRFRDQFERISSCKNEVDPTTKLTGLKIYAGSYLLKIIEMQEKSVQPQGLDIYSQVIEALNNYFNKTCDAGKERMKFREMRMGTDEPFEDWVLRLETQSKFCDFNTEQHQEEFLQAVLRRSVPEIADKLYEMSDIFDRNIERIVNHGQHLDFIRRESTASKKENVGIGASENMVNALHRYGRERKPYEGPRNMNRNFRGGYNKMGTRDRWSRQKDCRKCGRLHGPRQCKAFGLRCHKCKKIGHFAEFCFNREVKQQEEEKDSKEQIQKEVSKINQLFGEQNQAFRRHFDTRLVKCVIGTEGVEFLVDSGSSVNTITVHTWDILKRKCKSAIQEVVMLPKDVLKGYANEKPMDILCTFFTYVGVNGKMDKKVLAKFFVVKGTELALLGYHTSCELNILRVGSPDTVNWTESVQLEKCVYIFPKVPIEGIKFRVNKDLSPKQIIRYNIPKAFESATNARLDLMQHRDIIERADKEDYPISYVSPLVLVPKGKNDFRIVVDYREVNKAIIREPYPMPTLEKIWTEIPSGNGFLHFSKIDLKDAYFHIELHKDVRHYTTFMTANGLMRFKRLPFGLSCAPELFQKVMENLLIGCKNKIIYLDDILIYAKSIDELQHLVRKVKHVLKENNLEVNEKKSAYDKTSIEFLGFILDGSGILPAQNKISDIKLFRRPKDMPELRSFLGLMTFVSPFIKNFSHKTKLLRDLLTSKTKFIWSKEHQIAFDDLKMSAEEDLIKRGYFNERDETILYTDASAWGLGAVLVQKTAKSDEYRVIACASKSLTITESRYPQLHREALGIVWGMERFTYYLLGRSFILRSDSKALKFMIENKYKKDIGKRVMSRAEGWFLRLEHFTYQFEHVAGDENIADPASRICQKKNDPEFGYRKELHELCSVTSNPGDIQEHFFALTCSDIKRELEEDLELQTVINWLNKDKTKSWPSEIKKYQAFQDVMYLQKDFLMKEEKIVLPKSLHTQALHLAHRSHPGSSTMKHFLRQGLWWLGMDRDVEQFTRSCQECQLVVKVSRPLPIAMTSMPSNPWEFIAADFSSPSDTQKWKALVLTDYYSRFLVASPMEKTDTDAVKKVLKRVFRTYGIPSKIKLDNGPPFNSEELKAWLLKEWGVKITHTTPLNPTENGLVERSMQGINKIAAITKLNKGSFQESLAEYVAAYNSWPHSVTRIPPAELMFGRPVRTLLPNRKLSYPVNDDEELRDLDTLAKFSRNRSEDIRRNAGSTDINIGDTVLVMQQRRDKADTTYKNILHRVVNISGEGRVTILDLESGRCYDRNVKHLKKFVSRAQTADNEIEDNDSTQSHRVAVDGKSKELQEKTQDPMSNSRRSGREIVPPKRFQDFE